MTFPTFVEVLYIAAPLPPFPPCAEFLLWHSMAGQRKVTVMHAAGFGKVKLCTGCTVQSLSLSTTQEARYHPPDFITDAPCNGVQT